MAVKTEDLTQEKIDELFDIFRIVNRSHWKIPLLKLVQLQLQSKGQYEFKVGLQENWTQKFIIKENQGTIEIELEINQNQPPHIIEGLKKIKQYFDKELSKHI